MLINVHFLWSHVDILLASVILVIVVKTAVATVVVRAFGYGIRTSFLVSLYVVTDRVCTKQSNKKSCCCFITFIHFCSLSKVGMSLAQIGEFAFVLLSRASNLHLIEVTQLSF